MSAFTYVAAVLFFIMALVAIGMESIVGLIRRFGGGAGRVGGTRGSSDVLDARQREMDVAADGFFRRRAVRDAEMRHAIAAAQAASEEQLQLNHAIMASLRESQQRDLDASTLTTDHRGESSTTTSISGQSSTATSRPRRPRTESDIERRNRVEMMSRLMERTEQQQRENSFLRHRRSSRGASDALERFRSGLAEEKKAIIQEDRSIKAEQDEAYLKALEEDKEKERLREEEERLAKAEMEERESAERARELVRMQRLALYSEMGEEPPKGPETTNVKIRMPDGSCLLRRFLRTDSLQRVKVLIEGTDVTIGEYSLVSNFPKTDHTRSEDSFETAGLAPSAQLFVELIAA